MAKKQKHPEHENLERWLISYADFITLLFATFVVLYALSQVDIKDFQTLENSIRQAFAAPSINQGAEGIMKDNSDTIFDSAQADSMIAPLMMEYMNPKYEEESLQQIQKKIDEKVRSGELGGVETLRIDRGLIIRFRSDYLFAPGSAALTKDALSKLDRVGAIIGRKFILHNMRIEGHTDNQEINSKMYPSNWELSSARASAVIRYFISRFSFMPSLFTAVGFADTRPIASNNSSNGKARNRRVEILILKNKFNTPESPQNEIMKMTKEQQEKMQASRMATINRIDAISAAAKKSITVDRKAEQDAADLNKVYEKELQRLSTETNALDSRTKSKLTGQGSWLKPPATVSTPRKVSQIKVFAK